MSITVPCSKGCGTAITVSEEQIKEFQDLGQPVTAAHETCPTEVPKVQREFHITITISERVRSTEDPEDWEEEVLTSMGADVEATGSFSECLPELAKALDKQWTRLQENAQVIDGA